MIIDTIVIISQIVPPTVKHIKTLLISQTGDAKKNLVFLIKVPLLNIIEYVVTICATISASDHQLLKVNHVAKAYNVTISKKTKIREMIP